MLIKNDIYYVNLQLNILTEWGIDVYFEMHILNKEIRLYGTYIINFY